MCTLAYLQRECVADKRESSFRALSSMLLLIGEKRKLVKLVNSVNQFFQVFVGTSGFYLSNICLENRDGMTNISEA